MLQFYSLSLSVIQCKYKSPKPSVFIKISKTNKNVHHLILIETWLFLEVSATLMLGGTEGRRRRGRQRMRRLDGITDLMDVSLSELREDGQGGLACSDSCGQKESDMTER